jgi:hypothetical protein
VFQSRGGAAECAASDEAAAAAAAASCSAAEVEADRRVVRCASWGYLWKSSVVRLDFVEVVSDRVGLVDLGAHGFCWMPSPKTGYAGHGEDVELRSNKGCIPQARSGVARNMIAVISRMKDGR